MNNFIITSIIASVVLTLALNLLPVLFPKASRRAMDKIHETMENQSRDIENGQKRRVRVFFPWKMMILASVVLTVFLNFGSWLR